MAGLRSILLGSVAVVAFSSAASAADVAAPVNRLEIAPVQSWEGQYIGIHGGYTSGSNDINMAGVTRDVSPKSGFGGFQLGYNYHLSPRWVIGYEVDASFGDLNDTALIGANITPLKINAFGTARGRVGYATGPWLLYATAGAAWAHTKLDNVGGVADFERPHVGYAAGAGIEYAFAQNWSAKLEYIYAALGETKTLINGATVNTDLTMNTVRLGLNYRFANWARTATPAYDTKAPVGAAGWTGPYIGVHGGYGFGSFDTVGGAGVSQSQSPKGGLGGIQGGYNWQVRDNWVIGVESDASWGSVSRSSGGIKVDVDALGTARARIGYAINNNVLLYGTGGLAWAHADSTTAGATRDQFYFGGAVGGGVEYAFNPRWSTKIEYLYADFGKIHDFNGTNADASLDVSTVKVGLNYRGSVFDFVGLR